MRKETSQPDALEGETGRALNGGPLTSRWWFLRNQNKVILERNEVVIPSSDAIWNKTTRDGEL